MLDLRVLLEGIHRHVLADAALFVAAMRHLGGQRKVIVDPDGASLDGAAGAHGLENVTRPDGGRQTIDNAVGLLQDLFFGVEAAHDYHRTKDLVLHDLGVVAVLGDHRWLEEEAALQASHTSSFAAGENVAAAAQGALNKALNGGALPGGDEGTHVRALRRGIAYANLLDLRQEGVHERVVDAVLHVNTRGRCAVLAAVDIAAHHRAVGRRLN